MKIVDLTHTITPSMPVYPGTAPPELGEACTIKDDGFREKKLSFYSHTGTHMDSPSHIFAEGKVLDNFNLGHFFGRALVINASDITGLISLERLLAHQSDLQEVAFVLFYTGWDRYWGSDQYFAGYPTLTTDTAEWLANLGIKLVGVDAISVDPISESQGLAVHQVLLGKDILIVENLTNLKDLVGKRFTFCCLPLKIAEADGAPVRAVALLD